MNNFWAQAIASLVGAFGAFLLSIILFFITQTAREKKRESEAAANAAAEIETDIGILEEIKGQIDDLCQEVEIEKNLANLYVPMRFIDLLTVFISSAYSEGLLREILSATEITELNRLLGRNSKQTDDLNIYVLDLYRKGTRDKAETLRYFRSQKKQVDKDIKFLADIKGRLEKLSKKRRVAARRISLSQK